MASKGFSNEFLEVVRNLAAYYVLRQQLVVLAMLDLNTINLSEVGELNIRPYFDTFRKNRRKRWEERQKATETEKPPEPLIWKGDWKHIVHGAGCKLVNLRTGEPIEWDGPDVDVFNIDWFMNNLIWRLKNEPEDPYIKACNDWLSSQQTDTNTIQKVVFRLIELGVLKLKQNTYSCAIAKKEKIPPTQPISLPQEVITAILDAIVDYREKQKLAAAAMIELRPDFVVEVAEDPYLLPEVAQRLKALYEPLPTPVMRGPKIQTGRWNEVWDYDMRYAHCTITHIKTQEPIRWSSTDPITVDYHGFTQHFVWAIRQTQRDHNTQIINAWMEDFIQRTHNISIATHEHDSNYIGTAWYHLWDSLIANNHVVLIPTVQGTVIKLKNYSE